MTSVKIACFYQLEILRTDNFHAAYLNEEHPSPSRFSVITPKVEKTKGQEGRKGVRNGQGSPKESKAKGQFVVFVEVGKIQNDLYQILDNFETIRLGRIVEKN